MAPQAARKRATRGFRRQEVDLPGKDAADEQGIDQVVGMVDAEEDGSAGRDPLGPDHRDILEEEPDPDAANQSDEGGEPVHALGGLGSGRDRGACCLRR